MKIFAVFFSLAVISISGTAWAVEKEICAGTYQSFWQLEHKTKLLKLKAFYRHPETQFCEKSMTASPNALVELLDQSQKSIRKFDTYLQTKLFQDQVVNSKLSGSARPLTQQTLQIKFAEDSDFKKAKFMKITFADGSTYGPASF